MCSTVKTLAIAAGTALGGICSQSFAAEDAPAGVDLRSVQREGEVGINIFGLSLHTDRSEGHNELNPGIGVRYVLWEPAPRWAVFGDASVYYDSDRNWAKYVAVGGSYRFADAWTIGAGIAYAQSRTYNGGRPFFAIVPGVGFEYGGVIFNAVLLPSETADSKVAGLAFFVTVPLSGQSSVRR